MKFLKPFYAITLFFFCSSVFAKESKIFPTYKIGGQIAVDGGWLFEKEGSKTATDIRRARLFLKGDILKDISYEIEYDFKSNTKFKDIYLKYDALEFDTTLKVGNIKEPFSLQALTGSKYTTFMERALPNIFIFSRKVGFSVSKSDYIKKTLSWGVTAGAFLKPLENITDSSNEYSYVIRARYASFFKKNSLWHIGASGAYTNYDDNKLKLSIRPESYLSEVKYLKTKIKHTDKIFRYGFEGIYQKNSFTAQGEFIKEIIKTSTKKEYRFYGWYAQISYFLSENSKRYKQKEGLFGRIRLKNELSKNSLGAFESAFRISYANLNDYDKRGGEVYQYTFGLNWYIFKNLKIMANHITIDRKNEVSKYDQKILQFRILYDF